MYHSNVGMNRRQFTALMGAAAAAQSAPVFSAQPQQGFALRYMLGSCMYGYTKLQEIVPEVPKTGAAAIDIWPKVHGNQREQLDEMGERAFKELLDQHNVQLGCITQYKLGPFGLKDELPLAKRLGCSTIVTGGKGPRGLRGTDLKNAVLKFVEQMKPHLAVAHRTSVTIAIENHGNNLFETADSLKWLVEQCDDPHLAVALAPYHLPQDSEGMAKLIHSLGNRIQVFYAWEHGMGCMEKLPKDQELMQMPGRGDLDFEPILQALQAIDYQGWTEIFMHPVPRGIPILETTAQVTDEINRSREHLSSCLNIE